MDNSRRCELSWLSQCDGSALLSQGMSVSLAGVYGPADLRQSRQHIKRARLEVYVNSSPVLDPLAVESSDDQSELQAWIRRLLEPALDLSTYPRNLVELSVQCLQRDRSLPESEFSTCLNASCLAVLDAALAMNYTVASTTCYYKDGSVRIDGQCDDDSLVVSAAFESLTQKLVGLHTVNRSGKPFDPAAVQLCVQRARTACVDIFAFYREALGKKLLHTVSDD